MAKRKEKENEFDKLARLIKGESDDIRKEMHEGFAGLRTELTGRMDTGFARIDQDFASIRAELKSIRADIASLQAAVGEHEGYTKEIDHVLKRVAAIERHLGIKHVASK